MDLIGNGTLAECMTEGELAEIERWLSCGLDLDTVTAPIETVVALAEKLEKCVGVIRSYESVEHSRAHEIETLRADCDNLEDSLRMCRAEVEDLQRELDKK